MEDTLTQKLDSFFNKFTFVTGKKGDIFIHAEEDPAGIFYLKKGFIRQYIVTQKGEELSVNIYKTPAFFPMMWAINDTKNMFYFEAMTDVELWRAPREEVVAYIKTEPDILYDLLSRLYRGLDGILGRMTHLMAGNARAKVIFTLLNFYNRFGDDEKKELELNLDTTHKDLAAISGTTRETFSREIKKLENEALVKVDKGIIIIPNATKLEEELTTINRQHDQ